MIKEAPFEIIPPGTDILSIVETHFGHVAKGQKWFIEKHSEIINDYNRNSSA